MPIRRETMRAAASAAVAAALVLALAAGKCEGRDALIAKVQAATKQACGFVPLAATVAAILDKVGNTGGAATMVAAAASGICQAVTARAPQALYGKARAKPNFRGVPIEGEFISKEQRK